MTDVSGYAGKFLRVDLTYETLTDISFDEATLRKHIGGVSIGAKILYDEVSPKANWSDAENRIIISSGPLGGTVIPGSGTVCLVTKGALTNGGSSTQANGRSGAYLKFSGYDGIIIQGIARRWLYLNITDDGKAELRDANHLLGMDTWETNDTIKSELGKKEMEMAVISIGPAGENKVRFAGVFIDKGHSMSHNGSGAVMGSKRLKAIAIARGTQRVLVKDAEKLNTIANEFREGRKGWRGTIGGVSRGSGSIPVKNYTTNVWDVTNEVLEKYGEPYLKGHYDPKLSPCWACSAHHSTFMTIPDGPYKGMLVDEPEYEQMAAWGPQIDNRDSMYAVVLSAITDRVGLDNNEAGWLVGWVMECYEKGYLTTEDLGGLEMTWGNTEAARQLIYMVTHRQGFGDTLAEGVMRASQKVGGKAAECAIYTKKGNTPRGHDHRVRWTEMFDTVTSNTGTLESGRGARRRPTPQTTGPRPATAPPRVLVAPEATETVDSVTLGKAVMGFDDSLGTCRFQVSGIAPQVEALKAVTGWDFTPEEANEVALRTVNLMKVFNLRAGIGRDLDYPSTRYGSTVPDGPLKGVAVMPNWETMLENYYRLMGWDTNTGKPLPETLKKLGLEYIIKDL